MLFLIAAPWGEQDVHTPFAFTLHRDTTFKMMISEALVWSDVILHWLDVLDDELKETWAQVRK